jgi:hypothetical protein
MRDSLALALVRAEFCRAYAAQRAVKARKAVRRSILKRLLRSLRFRFRARAGATAA